MQVRIQLCLLFLLAALVAAPGLCQAATPEKRTDVLILCIDQPTRPFARELLEGIQQSVRDAIGLSVFVEFLGPTALESEEVAGQRRKLLAARYAGRPIGIVLAIGDRAVPEAEKLRNNFFPSANLLFLISSRDTIRTGIHQGEGLYVDVSPWPSLQVARSLMPERSRLIVVSGTSTQTR